MTYWTQQRVFYIYWHIEDDLFFIQGGESSSDDNDDDDSGDDDSSDMTGGDTTLGDLDDTENFAAEVSFTDFWGIL